MSLKYRADIDGLRALAVIPVMLFHAGIPGFSGGFVGVDVFFVISGFLITSVILKEINAGEFSLARFYERRIRRIFPALFSVMIFSLLVGTIILDPLAFKNFGETITATTLFASNILFWSQTGYFDAGSFTKPLLHTWSLAVEEQFYILFPLLLIAINRFSKSRCLPWLLAITLISFIACIYGSYTNKITAFYLMPTRAWELLFGSIIALGVIPQPSSNIHRNLISILGTGFILFCVAFYTEKTIFPGISALVPVVGASLIIYSGSEGETIISKILSRRPIVFIGLISYSLYLWHWPLIVYVKYLTIGDLTTLEKTSIIILSILISTLSLRFIEQPFRSATSVLQDRKKLFIFSSIVMFIASFIGCTIYLQKGMPYRYPKALLGLEKEMPLEKSVTTIKDCSITKIGAYNFPQSFILWGDSHAGVFVQALDEKAKAFGLSGYSMAKGSTSPVLGMEVSGSNEKGKFTTEVINFISAHKEIKTVIIAGFWTNDIELVDLFEEYPGRQPYLKLFRIGLFRTINKLIKMDRRVVLISDVPTLKDDPYRFPYVAYRLNATPDYKKIAPTINEYKNRNEGVLKIFNELSEINNVTIIHPELLLFDKAGYTIVLNNNQLLYRDSNHLSTYGGKYIGAVFDNEFMQMVKDKSSAR